MDTEQKIIAFTENFREQRRFDLSNRFILESEEHLPHMLQITEREQYPFSEHISWMLAHFSQKYPVLLLPYSGTLLRILAGTRNGTLQRNLLCILLNLPPLQVGTEWFDRLLELIQNPETKPAVKVNALKLCERWFLQQWPGLAGEVDTVLQQYTEDERPSIRSMIRNFGKRRMNKI